MANNVGRDALHLGAGALAGAYLQDPRKAWGSNNMSPEERARRSRRVRLGGALKGLSYIGGYKAINRRPTHTKHVAPIVGAIDGLATYATDDELYLRRVVSRKKNESKDEYARRLKTSRRRRALARGLASGTIYTGIRDVALEKQKLKDFGANFGQDFGEDWADDVASAGDVDLPTSVDEYKRNVLGSLMHTHQDTGFDFTGLARASNKAELEVALRKAHRRAALKAHPDRPGGSDEAMKRLNALKDELESGMSKLAFYRALYQCGKLP